jgi:hypothetical protein
MGFEFFSKPMFHVKQLPFSGPGESRQTPSRAKYEGNEVRAQLAGSGA